MYLLLDGIQVEIDIATTKNWIALCKLSIIISLFTITPCMKIIMSLEQTCLKHKIPSNTDWTQYHMLSTVTSMCTMLAWTLLVSGYCHNMIINILYKQDFALKDCGHIGNVENCKTRKYNHIASGFKPLNILWLNHLDAVLLWWSCNGFDEL